MNDNSTDQPTPTPEVLERSAGQLLALTGEGLLGGGAATLGGLMAKDAYGAAKGAIKDVIQRPPPSEKK